MGTLTFEDQVGYCFKHKATKSNYRHIHQQESVKVLLKSHLTVAIWFDPRVPNNSLVTLLRIASLFLKEYILFLKEFKKSFFSYDGIKVYVVRSLVGSFLLNPIFKVNMSHLFFRVGVDPEEEDKGSTYVSVSTVGFFHISVQIFLPLSGNHV